AAFAAPAANRAGITTARMLRFIIITLIGVIRTPLPLPPIILWELLLIDWCRPVSERSVPFTGGLI
ncbi:hypothetical protein, partial [Serratia marcescens]|uniref:hypothetical protein n=1 Tax=Serratia marcescens TaxID=615 RepID=UPI002FDB5DF4